MGATANVDLRYEYVASKVSEDSDTVRLAKDAIAAVEAGTDVYVQKPISVDVAEGQAMLATARKHKRVVQVGTQRRSTPHIAEARREFIKSGKLGKIAHVEICCYYHMRQRGQYPPIDPPEYLDWNAWTGPARGWNWGAAWGRFRVAPSISRTACSPICANCSTQAVLAA